MSAFIGAAASIVGLSHGYNLMHQFDLPVQIGVGGVALTAIFLLVAVIEYRRFRPNTA